MYNDYGSVTRDEKEQNLNSVNFPEFCSTGDGIADITAKKAALLELAKYEHDCLERALDRLRDHIDGHSINVLQMFCNVTDTFGQIYVLKDIGTHTK